MKKRILFLGIVFLCNLVMVSALDPKAVMDRAKELFGKEMASIKGDKAGTTGKRYYFESFLNNSVVEIIDLDSREGSNTVDYVSYFEYQKNRRNIIERLEFWKTYFIQLADINKEWTIDNTDSDVLKIFSNELRIYLDKAETRNESAGLWYFNCMLGKR